MVRVEKITQEQFESGTVGKPLSKPEKKVKQKTVAQTPKSSGLKMQRPWVNLDQVTEYRPDNNEWDRD